MWGEPLRRCGGRWVAGALLGAALGTACVEPAEGRAGDTPEPYVPGLGEIMAATQMRHLKLWYAGEARNWPLAAYEIDELEEGFADAARFHPRHKSSPRPLTELIPEFTDGPVAALRKAIAARSQPDFVAAFDTLTQGCNGCFGLVEIERSKEDGVDRHGRIQGLRPAVLSSSRTRELLALCEWEEAPVGAGGLDHFGFVLESDAELARLLELVLASGGSVEKTGTREHRGCREAYAYVHDPDGYAIELATQAALYSCLQDGGAA